MAFNLDALPAGFLASLDEFHLGVLAVVRADGSPHATVVGFTYDPDARLVRIISRESARKVAHIADRAPVTLTTVVGPQWLTLAGTAEVVRDPNRVAEAVARYEARYRPAGEADNRMAIEITVDTAYGTFA
jgi:F420H(2)-dependent biliverdin reductase